MSEEMKLLLALADAMGFDVEVETKFNKTQFEQAKKFDEQVRRFASSCNKDLINYDMFKETTYKVTRRGRMKYDRWKDFETPDKRGWYAVNYCWDVREGSFCESIYFDGERFDYGGCISLPCIMISKKRFRSKIGCDNWLEKNDISH